MPYSRSRAQRVAQDLAALRRPRPPSVNSGRSTSGGSPAGSYAPAESTLGGGSNDGRHDRPALHLVTPLQHRSGGWSLVPGRGHHCGRPLPFCGMKCWSDLISPGQQVKQDGAGVLAGQVADRATGRQPGQTPKSPSAHPDSMTFSSGRLREARAAGRSQARRHGELAAAFDQGWSGRPGQDRFRPGLAGCGAMARDLIDHAASTEVL